MPTADALDTNLLRTKGKSGGSDPKGSLQAGKAAWTRKRIAKLVAYAAFFLWSLVTFTLLKIPDSVIANSILNTLNQSTPYNWQAEKIGVSFFPWPHLRMEKLGLEPKFPGAGIPLFLDEVRIYPNPFSLIPIGGASAFGGSFRAEAYKSVVKGSFGMGKDLFLRVTTDSLDLTKVTPLVGRVDVKGVLNDFDFRIYLPNQRVGNADGAITVKGKNFQLDPSGLGLPMALPLLNLGELDIDGTITHGQVKIEKFKVGAGKDLDVQIPNGTINLSDVTPNTRYDLHLLLKPSTVLEQAVPGLAQMLGSFATLKPDGHYALRIQGTLMAPGFPVKD